ncbi:hypothetical protein ACF0H5_016032 [Mactra antiquata]
MAVIERLYSELKIHERVDFEAANEVDVTANMPSKEVSLHTAKKCTKLVHELM